MDGVAKGRNIAKNKRIWYDTNYAKKFLLIYHDLDIEFLYLEKIHLFLVICVIAAVTTDGQPLS